MNYDNACYIKSINELFALYRNSGGGGSSSSNSVISTSNSFTNGYKFIKCRKC
jgi:hypothetical protein